MNVKKIRLVAPLLCLSLFFASISVGEETTSPTPANTTAALKEERKEMRGQKDKIRAERREKRRAMREEKKALRDQRRAKRAAEKKAG